ncbi:MAG: rod shape-determining protein MreC [Lachnospiraceae bacterium]
MPILKQKQEKEKLPSKYILFSLSLLCVLLMIASFTSDAFAGAVRNVAGFLVVPFQNGVSAIGNQLVESQEEKQTIAELKLEIERLNQEIDSLNSENMLLMQDKYELTSLRQLYDLDAQYQQYEKVGAHIISWDSSNWYSSFLIDKGSADGMQIDMNVIAGSGLVGRITEVGLNWSRVTPIINDNSNVSAYVLHTQDNLIVSGDLEMAEQNKIPFSQLLDNQNQVAIGDKVVTSYISNKYLPGILVGYIESIEMDSNNLTKVGYITPAVDFTHLTEVLVITQLKEMLEDAELESGD